MIRGISGRPTWAEIDLNALRWNFKQVRQLVGSKIKILAVVKANAYGHGAVGCASVLEKSGVHALGVASVEEAAELRKAGIRVPLIVFGIVQLDEMDRVIQLDLQPTVVDLVQARALDVAAKKKHRHIKVQVKVDTGMGRIGISAAVSFAFARALKICHGIQVQGVFTHFSHADGRDKKMLHHQMDELKRSLTVFKAAGYTELDAHAANSAAVMESPSTHLDQVRPGLMLYGVYPAKRFFQKAELKPVLTWKTRIIQLKTVFAGTGISYGHTYVTKRKSMIATLPVGYADGFSRGLSNCGRVLVRGKKCPVIGRVCMDMCLVDVSGVPGVATGDEVVLIGKQRGRRILVDEMAARLNTISYELLCAIGQRVPRIMKGERR
ncbi:alanine racemase [bacterium]|nr:alanine racemase [bacterium]